MNFHKIYFLIFFVLFLPLTSCTKSSSTKVETSPKMKHAWIAIDDDYKQKRQLFGVNDDMSVQRGKMLYVKHCSECHGLTGAGDGPRAKEAGVKPANLKVLSGQRPNHYLSLKINSGSGDMPKWSDLLEPQQIWDITNYIQSLVQQR